MTGRRFLLLLLATVLAAATAVLAGIAVAAFLGLDARAAEAAPRTGTPFSWSGTLAAGKRVSIHGVSGSVRARPATGRTVEVSATKSSNRCDPERARVEVVAHADGVTFCVVSLDKNGRARESCTADGIRSRHWDFDDDEINFDFEVSIPAGVDFEVDWVNGEVTAEQLDGDLDLETVNGDVVFSTKRTARAETVNGSIQGSIGSPSWTGTLAFESVNGDVQLNLPRSLRASIRAETVHGEIESDFPGNLEGDWGPQSFRGEIGGGGSRLRIETVNGSVRLRTNT